MARTKPLSPGRSKFLKDAVDLTPPAFRRLVARRARRVLGREIGLPEKEPARRALEREIALEVVNLEADFLPARFLARGARRAKAVCRITVQLPGNKLAHGTGFLVGPGLVMTNNHVLASVAEASGAFAEFGFGLDETPLTVQFRPDATFVTSKKLDFTIVACETRGLAEIEPIALLRDPAGITRGEAVNIVQHPDGRPKEVAIHDNRVVRVKDLVIRYETDTEPGSSGSPVFNNDWELVALHHAGAPLEGGRAENEGIRISAIVNHLARLGSQGSGLLQEASGALRRIVVGTSPYLGFFDVAGLGATQPEVEIPRFEGTPEFADVGFWNIEHFNAGVADDRIEAVADVVAGLGMDVLGLVEVERPALDRLVEDLRGRGSDNAYVLHNVTGTQDLAILYDRDTTEVELLNGALEQRFKAQLKAKTPTGKTAFPRTPLFAKCTVKDPTGGVGSTFLAIVVHLKAFGDEESRARRTLAAEKLVEMVASLRESEGLPVLLGGDYNDRLGTPVFAALQDSPDLVALTADDAATDAISYVGASHRSLIDHIVVSRDTRLGQISSDDAAIVRLDRSVADFAGTVSDHVPVVVRLVMRDKTLDVSAAAGTPEAPSVLVPVGSKRLEFQFTGRD